jgi:hypothetical protein
MRTIILAIIVAVVIFFGTIVVLGLNTKPAETMAYPEYAPIIVKDKRTYCEAKSETNAQLFWRDACTTTKREPECTLPKNTAESILKAKEFYIENCNR